MLISFLNSDLTNGNPSFSNNNTINSINDENFCNISVGSHPFLIVHQNIRSLRQNFDLLVCNLEAFPYLPDIIFVSEIWIYQNESNNFPIPGYNFHIKSNEAYPAGGVGVFVRESLKYNICI